MSWVIRLRSKLNAKDEKVVFFLSGVQQYVSEK